MYIATVSCSRVIAISNGCHCFTTIEIVRGYSGHLQPHIHLNVPSFLIAKNNNVVRPNKPDCMLKVYI